MLLTEETNNTVTFGKSKQKSVSFVERFISIFILLLSLRIHEQQQLVLSGDRSRPVSLPDLTAVPWKKFMLTKSKKYEDQIFFLTLSCLPVPELCFSKKSKGRVGFCGEQRRDLVEQTALCVPCNTPWSGISALVWTSSAVWGKGTQAPNSRYRRQHVAGKRFMLFSWMFDLSGNLAPFVRQPLFPLNQRICQYFQVLKTIFPFSFLLASFERNVLF